jgi:hypothetical protein
MLKAGVIGVERLVQHGDGKAAIVSFRARFEQGEAISKAWRRAGHRLDRSTAGGM